jgi:hypothetical protein
MYSSPVSGRRVLAGTPWVGTLDNPSGAGWFTEYWSAVVERKGHDR